VPSLTPVERTLRARLAAHTLHAKGRTNTVPAREAFDQRFYDQALADDPALDGQDLEKRAGHYRSAYFARLALKSARARRKVAS